MRLNNKHEVKNLLANKRLAVIQKAHHNIHVSVQLTNNRLIDKKIIEWNNEIPTDYLYDPYNEAVIAEEISKYNKISISQDLQRTLKKSIVKRNIQSSSNALKVLNEMTNDLSTIEAERIIKNINYVENVLNNANVDIKKYEALINELPERTSRQKVLERCIQTDQSLPPTRRQEFLEKALERGENYKGRKYTYRELEQLSRDLEKYKTNRIDYETAKMENRQANQEGYENINQTKTWIWSNAEKTRHTSMDGETIPLNDKFEVINEQTGDIDYLLFPGDVTNDHNNCSNICNCLCSYEINQG